MNVVWQERVVQQTQELNLDLYGVHLLRFLPILLVHIHLHFIALKSTWTKLKMYFLRSPLSDCVYEPLPSILSPPWVAIARNHGSGPLVSVTGLRLQH